MVCWAVAVWLQRRGRIEPADADAVGEEDRVNG
jgi:hypothetical protein